MRRSRCDGPGYTRRRRGAGIEYLDPKGRHVSDPELIERFNALVIPPAWQDVWICPHATGHIQAMGTDDAGRRQYLYHQQWRESKNAIKHERVLALAHALPGARTSVSNALKAQALTRQRTLAVAFRLLDEASIRVGSEQYAQRYATYGLATLQRKHASVDGEQVRLKFRGKGSQLIELDLLDRSLARAVGQLIERPGRSPRLLAYEGEGGPKDWRSITSTDVNGYIKEVTGGEFSAKDFRTWNATVLMAVELATLHETHNGPITKRAANAMIRDAVTLVSAHLCNTPTVARSSYIDPRVIELFTDDVVLPIDLASARSPQGRLVNPNTEQAVLRMLEDPRRAAREFAE